MSSCSNNLLTVNQNQPRNDSEQKVDSQSNLYYTELPISESRRSSSNSLRTLFHIKKFTVKDQLNKEDRERIENAVSKSTTNKLGKWNTKSMDQMNNMEILHQAHELILQEKKKIQLQRRFVDVNIVYKGIEYYRFLSECLPPASVPDVPFMSALLDLESPLISKAAFLLETAYFVNRCNRKDWPEWIKMNIGTYLPRTGSSNNFFYSGI